MRHLSPVCTGCGKPKNPSDFYKSKDHSDGMTSRCKECYLKKARAYYQQDRVRIVERERKARKEYKVKKRDSVMRKLYGIDTAEYDRIVTAQGNQCAVCGASGSLENYGKLHVDHDHGTGKVRGLLCNRCNRAIGLFQDDPAITEKATKYLRRFDEASHNPANAG